MEGVLRYLEEKIPSASFAWGLSLAVPLGLWLSEREKTQSVVALLKAQSELFDRRAGCDVDNRRDVLPGFAASGLHSHDLLVGR